MKIDEETQKKALEALERQKKTYKRQNKFINENYDRISVTLPKGTKERIKDLTGQSVNGFVSDLVVSALKDLERKQEDSDIAEFERLFNEE